MTEAELWLTQETDDLLSRPDANLTSRVFDAGEGAETFDDKTATAPETVITYNTEEDSPNSLLGRAAEWAKKHAGTIKWAGAGALALASGALTFMNNGFQELREQVVETLPWAVAAGAATEVAFVAGGAMMLTAAGMKVGGNVLKIRKKTTELQEQMAEGETSSRPLRESMLFRAGFVINTAGALGTAAVVAAGGATLPSESWPGVAGLVALDVASTFGLRAAILRAAGGWRAESTDTDTEESVAAVIPPLEDAEVA
ncbi:MAG TPA: hypothetical protein VK694_01385 [Verrucomicrobiae bacterium]|nr:hypothetical protein [Verrucomicrobiae bacterium]